MSVGIVILAHQHLERVRQVVRTIASQKCRVVIHVDAKADREDFQKLTKAFAKNANIAFVEQTACEWGTFSLVEAGLSAAALLLKRWPDVSHVTQISGSCLPIRPAKDLIAFLDNHPNTDFVENRPATDTNSVIDGLRQERFTLYFPFSWRKQRWLFDRTVDLQRRIGVNRKMPEGVTPHIGSQWWTLSAQTLRAILDDPDRARYNRFFRKCWIPDESYVPSLVHKHSSNVINQSLCLSNFDDQGKPHIFYDDHLPQLAQTDFFFARKIWHGADKLYRTFATRRRRELELTVAGDLGIDVMFQEAAGRRCRGRPGRVFAGRFPAKKHERQPATCAPYGVMVGFEHAIDQFTDWLTTTTGVIAHGRLFSRQKVAFAGNVDLFEGAIAANPRIRDANPEQFVGNILWSRRDAKQTLLFDLTDSVRMGNYFARDPNAQVCMLRGGWLFALAKRATMPDAILAKIADRHMTLENKMIEEAAQVGRTLHIVDLNTLTKSPNATLNTIQSLINPIVDLRPKIEAPLNDMTDMLYILDRLRDLGVVPIGTDDITRTPKPVSLPAKRATG